MALPTVQYKNLEKGHGNNFTQIMKELQTLMLAAGWTVAYADATAIGAGSASNPAWDVTPGSAIEGGVAIYQMPANGFTRQWYVKFDIYYATATTVTLEVTVGTGESSGSLTGAGDRWQYTNLASFNTIEQMLAASEDGFAWVQASTLDLSIMVMSVERARTLAGVVEEDVIIQGYNPTGTVGVSGVSDYSAQRMRGSDGLAYSTGRWAVLSFANLDFDEVAEPATESTVVSFTSADGENGQAAGPFAMSGRLAGIPRLVCYMWPSDCIPNSDHPIFVDGGVKLYRTPTDVDVTAFTALVARE